MSKKIILLSLILMGCSQMETPHKPHIAKEFSREEIINATQLLTRIFDNEMAPLSCVPDTDEASLLLRTIRPRMEMVQDDIEAMLDNPLEIDNLIKNCEQNCTCQYFDDLFREHLVGLTKEQQKLMEKNKSPKVINRCMNYAQSTFCKSELYQELNKEKVDFSFEE